MEEFKPFDLQSSPQSGFCGLQTRAAVSIPQSSISLQIDRLETDQSSGQSLAKLQVVLGTAIDGA